MTAMVFKASDSECSWISHPSLLTNMSPLSSPPDSSTPERSTQRGGNDTKTHRKHTSKGGGSKDSRPHAERGAQAADGATESHTDARATHHKTHTPRRSGTHDGKVSEEVGKRFSFTKLLATPFFLVGGALSAAGGVLFGVGSMVKGMGRKGE